MKKIVVVLALLLIFVNADEKKITSKNSSWYAVEGLYSDSLPLPAGTQWKPKEFDVFIIPDYSGHAPHLKDFEVAKKAFPRMLDLAAGPPADGITYIDHKEVTRYSEYINEQAYETDDNLEYLLKLTGEWSLDEKFRNDNYLVRFNTGSENWIDLSVNGKHLAGARGSITVTGSSFPDKGQAIIKCSSLETNNKGLISVQVFKAYEKFIADPFGRALKDQWYLKENRGKVSIKGLPSYSEGPVTSKAVLKLPWPAADTTALYRRTYECDAKDSEKNIYVSADDSITHLWVNGKAVDLNSGKVADGVFKQGDNEVLYYTESVSGGIKSNLKFHSVRPVWLKTFAEAEENSAIAGLLRGAKAKVYINGKYAGLMHPEKPQEFLGAGLFNKGKNEIILCLLQNDERTFLEHLTIKKVNTETSLLLAWYDGEKELAGGRSTLNQYDGFYLNNAGTERELNAKFYIPENESDLELKFDSGKRFPQWMFKEKLHAPGEITLNGQKIKRTGHSFVLPAAHLKDINTIKINTDGLTIPEPVLYTSSKAEPQIYAKLKEVSQGSQLKPGVYFSGEKLNFIIDWDNSLFGSLKIKLNGKDISPQEITSVQKFSVTPDKTGKHELAVYAGREGREYKVQSRILETVEKPQDPGKWIQDNAASKDVIISETAFYNSESTLFPGEFKNEWARRERLSDSDSFNFGPLRSWNNKSGFTVFETLPNGVPVIEKFGRRLQTYLKIQSGARPVNFIFVRSKDQSNLWKSAAFTFQYLLWIQKKGIEIDWSLESLDEIHSKYVEAQQKDAEEYLSFRVNHITKIIKSLALQTAPGSSFEEKLK